MGLKVCGWYEDKTLVLLKYYHRGNCGACRKRKQPVFFYCFNQLITFILTGDWLEK